MLQVICRTSNRFFVGLPLCQLPSVFQRIRFEHLFRPGPGLPRPREPGGDGRSRESTVDQLFACLLATVGDPHLHPFLIYIGRRTFGPFISSLNSNMRRADKHLTPLVAERLRKMEELGKDWPGKPVQFFSCCSIYGNSTNSA